MPPATDRAIRLLRWRLLATRLVILWEESWPVLWPILALIAAFLALALFGVLPRLPGWLHLAVLVVFAAALIAALGRILRIGRPTMARVRRRLELASGFAHGPLQALADDLALGNDDPTAQALWDAHRRRLGASLTKLRVPLPQPVLPRHDPLGLRFAAMLLLLIALAGAWRETPGRIESALTPDMNWLIGAPPTLQAWITPPDYTRQPPLMLGNLPAGQPVRVPAGSKLLAELQGGSGTAKLDFDGGSRDFQALDASSQRIEATITTSGDLEIRQGWRRVGQWQVDVQPDHAPTIAFTAPPQADQAGRLKFEIEASDDWGVAKTWVEMVRSGRGADKSATVELPLAGHPKHVEQSSWHDLTSSPWAGLEVTLVPHATDDAGQSSAGPPVTVTLPERIFRNPAARAIIAVRKMLAADPEDRDTPVEMLEQIYSNVDAWRGDMVVALALSDAKARLSYDPSDAAVDSTMDTLWQTALRLEEGDRPEAERAVDEASQALEKALAENAPDSEIGRLTAELKQAIDRLLRSMVQQALQNGQTLPEAMPGDKTISEDDLNRTLDQMRDMARTGSRDAARQTLDELRQMLDSLRAGRPSTANRQQREQANRLSNALQGIIKDQESLLDETHRRDQAEQGDPNADASAVQRQEVLRHRLGDAMQMLGDLGADIPDSLGDAEQAMRDSAQALSQGDLGDAAEAQGRAVTKLREGMRASGQALAQQFGPGSAGVVRGDGQTGEHGQDDPLGRPLDNQGRSPDEQGVKIPAEADLQKAREVLDELRRRSGDAHRPTAERQYLDRLLRQLF